MGLNTRGDKFGVRRPGAALVSKINLLEIDCFAKRCGAPHSKAQLNSISNRVTDAGRLSLGWRPCAALLYKINLLEIDCRLYSHAQVGHRLQVQLNSISTATDAGANL
jgi:hypothetical protein